MVQIVVFINLFLAPLFCFYIYNLYCEKKIAVTPRTVVEYGMMVVLNIPLTKGFIVGAHLLLDVAISIDSGYYTIFAILAASILSAICIWLQRHSAFLCEGKLFARIKKYISSNDPAAKAPETVETILSVSEPITQTVLLNCSKRTKIITVLISIVFGFAYMLAPILISNNVTSINWFRLPLGIFYFLFAICVAVYALNWYHSNTSPTTLKCSDRTFFFISFSLITAVGIFYLLIYYPGVGMYDTVAIMMRTTAMAKQHPWFYCLLIQFMTEIVFFFGGDYESAFVVESVLQILGVAGVVSYCLTWLKKKGLSRTPLLIALTVYAFCPILNLYMITLFKDIPFSCVVFIWATLLYDFWESGGKEIRKKSFLCKAVILLILSLLRNNGVYISLFILAGCLIFCAKEWKRVVALFCVLGLVIVGSVTYEKANSIQPLFKESVGIPLQQIAATVHYGGEITEDQKAFINQILPIEFIEEKYSPYSVDPLKWGGSPIDDQFLYEHKAEFLKVWAEMLIPNFKIYVRSYLQLTYGFWAPKDVQAQRYSSIYVSAFDEWFQENDISIKTVFPEKVQTALEDFTYAGTSIFWGEGHMFWAFIFAMSVLVLRNRNGIWLIGAPCLGGWLTIMISAPLAYSWRYTFYLALSLPLLWGIMLLPAKKAET